MYFVIQHRFCQNQNLQNLIILRILVPVANGDSRIVYENKINRLERKANKQNSKLAATPCLRNSATRQKILTLN